jgi:oxygen-independent coproporphyrinogen-3 oxidase
MGLRLREGVDLAALGAIADLAPEEIVNMEAIRRLEQHGLVALEQGRLRATRAGMLLLDGILAEIVR